MVPTLYTVCDMQIIPNNKYLYKYGANLSNSNQLGIICLYWDCEVGKWKIKIKINPKENSIHVANMYTIKETEIWLAEQGGTIEVSFGTICAAFCLNVIVITYSYFFSIYIK